MNQRKNILSGITTTNRLQLGNFIGALKNWVKIEKEYQCYFFAADLHSLTSRQDPKTLAENTYLSVACYLAAGIDPAQSIIFLQSEVPEHAELAWILNCYSYMGEMSRMTQYKDKSEKAGANIPVGIFTYPILMAADILLYDANLVPVGADQKQHLEITRDIAERCNALYGKDTFAIPEPFIPKVGARIMDLQDPTMKMSKSASTEMGAIYLTDSAKDIEKKFKRAMTDSGSEIVYSESNPGIKNLIEIQSSLTGKAPDAIVREYAGKQYGHLKIDTANIVIAELAPFQKRVQELMIDKKELRTILDRGRDRARAHARKTLQRVYSRIGLATQF